MTAQALRCRQQRSRSRRSRNRSNRRARSRLPPSSAQIVGQRREIEILKDEQILGITVSDNTNGLTYVRRIRPDSVCARMVNRVRVGDQIEKVNGESMLNRRHFQVAQLLRSIPIGQVIKLGLISAEVTETKPAAAVVSSSLEVQLSEMPIEKNLAEVQEMLATSTSKSEKKVVPKVQKETPNKKLIECINKVFEEYLGFNDDDLALSIWNLMRECTDILEMSDRIRESAELSQFEFPEDLIFDMWGIVDDYRHKRLEQLDNAGTN